MVRVDLVHGRECGRLECGGQEIARLHARHTHVRVHVARSTLARVRAGQVHALFAAREASRDVERALVDVFALRVSSIFELKDLVNNQIL